MKHKQNLLAAMATAAMIATGPSAAVAGQMTDARISIAITETISGYNPYADPVVLVGSLWCKVYGCVTRFDFEQGRFIPSLAESLEPEDDLNWIVTLPEGLLRHDGDPVVADDIVHSIELTRSHPASAKAYVVASIAKAEALDERRVRITTTLPDATLADTLSLLVVTSKKLFEEHGDAMFTNHPQGAGPYKLVEVSIGNHMVLERFDEHPLISPDNPKQIMYRIMAEPEQRVTALANGEVQIAQGVPPQLVNRVNDLPNARIETINSVEMMFLAMSPKTHPWDVKEARQAVAHAINREGIVRALLGGQANLLNGPVSAGQFGFDPDYRTPYDYDPAKAKALLAGAGLEGVEIDFHTPVGRYTTDRQIAEAMVPMLEEVGFKVNLRTPEWATLWSNVQIGEVPFYYMGRGSMLDPSRALSQYFETGGSPRIGYSNPELDALLQAERAEFDIDARTVKMQEAIAFLTEDVPAHFLWQHQMAWGVAEGIGFTPRPADRADGWEIHILD
ncbi:ABC transporter substrate-binding protein [Mesorhizobium sp. SB112]|uniref:ABC transporter substrate-binding protein n=1 Tax=Mesorhizobium sp. SB112 TaxID=3151853 RepID=UPI003265F2D7